MHPQECVQRTSGMQQYRSAAYLAFILYFVLLWTVEIGDVYVEVDTIKCANLMDQFSPRLIDGGTEFHTQSTGGSQITFNDSLITQEYVGKFTIEHPNIMFKTSCERQMPANIDINNQCMDFMRKYRQLGATSTPPNSVISAMMVVPVKFQSPYNHTTTGLTTQIEAVVKNFDLAEYILLDSSATTLSLQECFWYVQKENAISKLVCAVILQHNTCVYLPYREDWYSSDRIDWIIDLVSLMSGMGTLSFKYNIMKTMQYTDGACADAEASTHVRKMPFQNCQNMTIIADCFKTGIPCNIAQSTDGMREFWNTYSVIVQADPSHIRRPQIFPTQVPGEFTVQFDKAMLKKNNHKKNS